MFEFIFAMILLGGNEAMAHAVNVPKVEFNPQVLIVNGTSAEPNEFPWQVRLRYLPRGSPSYDSTRCGGSLIAKNLVLTAAHCVVNRETNIAFEPKDLLVITGDHDTRRKDQYEQSHAVKKIIPHPKYNISFITNRTYSNDIALIVMESSIDCTVEVNIIPLPWKYHMISLSDLPPEIRSIEEYGYSPECYSTGWGSTHVERYVKLEKAYVLQKLKRNKILKQGDAGCKTFTTNRVDIVSPDEICARNSEEEIAGVCNGDSGGPLFCKIKDHWELIGIASWVGNVYCGHAPGMT